MFQHRSNRFAIPLTAVFFSLCTTVSTAQAVVALNCPYKDTIFNGEVDFGSGSHGFGSPQGSASIGWRFQSVDGAIAVRARIQGRLYLDKIGAGCARIRINFQDINFNNLQATTDIPFCGLGFDANSAANRRDIDVTSVPNSQLRRVQITLGAGPTIGSIEDLHTGGARAPLTDVDFGDRINNGNTDFGGNSHFWGGPSSDGHVSLLLSNNGIVFGRVNGVLYWDDAFSGGTARMITQFRNRNGTNLQTRTDQVTGNGGDANTSANKVGVFRLFNSTSLHSIRLRVGRVSNGQFVNVTTKNYSFACPPQ